MQYAKRKYGERISTYGKTSFISYMKLRCRQFYTRQPSTQNDRKSTSLTNNLSNAFCYNATTLFRTIENVFNMTSLKVLKID